MKVVNIVWNWIQGIQYILLVLKVRYTIQLNAKTYLYFIYLHSKIYILLEIYSFDFEIVLLCFISLVETFANVFSDYLLHFTQSYSEHYDDYSHSL